MNTEVERAAVRLLAECATPSLSLRELHALVVAEVGSGAGSYGRFREDIDRRSDLFAIVVPHDPLVEADRWPASVLTEYRGALRALGVDAEPHVVLASHRLRGAAGGTLLPAVTWAVGSPEPPTLVGRLGASLLELFDRAAGDPTLQRLLGSAMADTPAIANVIHPRGDQGGPSPRGS